VLHFRSLTLREITLPLREPFRISSGLTEARRILLIEAVDVDGFSIWSECVAGEAPNYGPETIDTAWHAIREWVAPRILGRPFDDPGAIHPALERDFRGHRMAKAAVEMAGWGLEAERSGLPLAGLLGGTAERVPAGISLGIHDSPSALVERVGRALEAGYRRIKVKVAPGEDVPFVGAVREAFGETVPLMVDANCAYTLDDMDALADLDRFGLMMIEQPLGADDLVGHAELQRRLTTPICLDECITSVDRLHDMISLGSGRIVNLKPGRVGGLGPSLAIHDAAKANEVPLWCGGMLESGIGRAYNVALASLPGFTLPGDVSPSARYWEQDVVVPPWEMTEGMIPVPGSPPGLGVAVDRDRIETLTVRLETIAV